MTTSYRKGNARLKILFEQQNPLTFCRSISDSDMKERTMNEKQNDSHEVTDGVRDTSVANTRSGRPPDDSDADPDLTWEADAQLCKAMSRLRAVRVPGKGKLTLQQAMEVASEQYEVYREWSRKGGRLGKLKAWVEGKEVFKTLGPPVFDSFSFNWPPFDEGVLQITTEHERKQVVLYNLRLHDVPPERSVHKELLPNGQHLVLTITRHVTLMASAGTSSRSSKTERFSINIAIQSQLVAAKTFARSELLELKRMAGQMDDIKPTEDYRGKLAFVPSSISKHPSLVVISKPPVAVVICVLTIVVVLMLVLGQSSKSLQASSMGFSDASLIETASAETKAPESISPMLVAANTTRLNYVQAKSPNRQSTIGWRLNDLLPTSVSPRREATMVKIAASELSKAQPLANTRDERLAHYRAIEKRFAAIAGLQHVSVRVKNSEVSQADRTEWVRSVFAQAFQASPRFKVLNDSDQSKAELVIGLRFEPTERTSGFVFVDIRDSNGKFIWQDFADCTESRPSEPGGSFLVVAGNLVSGLEEVMGSTK
jgi:hypothetical protein